MRKLLAFLILINFFACDTSNTPAEKKQKGPKNGLVHTYNEDGSVSASINYKDGIRHGVATDFYTDGKLRAEIDYVNGLKEGTAKWYHKNGQVFRTTEYLANLRNGFQRKYYEDGTLMSEIVFHDDQPGVGLKEFNKSGRERIAKVDFVFDMPATLSDGSLRYHVKLNNKVKEVTLYQGNLKDGKFLHDGMNEINKTSNTGFVTIPKGVNEVTVVAKYKTRYKNYRLVKGIAKR